MKISLHQQLSRRERRVAQRIEKKNWSGQSPMIAPPSIEFELSDRIQAVNAGGLGVIQQLNGFRIQPRPVTFVGVSIRSTLWLSRNRFTMPV